MAASMTGGGRGLAHKAVPEVFRTHQGHSRLPTSEDATELEDEVGHLGGHTQRRAGPPPGAPPKATPTEPAVLPDAWRRRVAGARWWRDVALFAAGAVVASAGMAWIDPMLGGAAEGPWPGRCAPRSAGASGVQSYAFVTMAYDAPRAPGRQLWRALALARAVQRVSAYPLVLLSNDTAGVGEDALQRMGVLRRPLALLDIPGRVRSAVELPASSAVEFMKLQIWRLTEFDKLIWLDPDSVLVRSVDWLFQTRPPQAQRHNEDCAAVPRGLLRLRSSLLLIQPNEDAFWGLIAYAARMEGELWKLGPDMLIQSYFRDVANDPVQILDATVADFGVCLGRGPKLVVASEGPWEMPAFVHKASESSECFSPHRSAQESMVDGRQINVCHFHPLGTWWRSLFCSAVKELSITGGDVTDYCDEVRWYGVDR